MLKYKLFKKNELLEDFLRKKRLLKKFSNNINITPSKENELLNISSSFVFNDTPEGGDFWYKISLKYNEYCKNKKQSLARKHKP